MTYRPDVVDNLQKLVKSLTSPDELLFQPRQVTPFEIKTKDITSALEDSEITFPPCRFIQATVDGGSLDGISIKLASRDNVSIPLSVVDVIPAGMAYKLYLTSDVRAGRSQLRLWFVKTEPLHFHLGGDISVAELAARLGSIHTFDRRGEIIFADDFENGLTKYTLVGVGTGNAVAISTNKSYSGACSVKLHTGSDAQDDSAGFHKTIAYPSSARTGIQTKICMPSANGHYVYLRLAYYNGTNLLDFRIRYDLTEFDLDYYSGLNTWTAIDSNLILAISSDIFHVFKLVIDPTAGKYLRAIVNNSEYDLSEYTPYTSANTSKQLTAQINGYTNIAAAVDYYVNDLLITQNEP